MKPSEFLVPAPDYLVPHESPRTPIEILVEWNECRNRAQQLLTEEVRRYLHNNAYIDDGPGLDKIRLAADAHRAYLALMVEYLDDLERQEMPANQVSFVASP